MPKPFWDFFWLNRSLLNKIGALTADCIQTIAKTNHIIPGIFIAIHTFGRDLKRNVHVHLSTTTGGLTTDLAQWKTCFFDQQTLMRLWRYRLIKLFRQEYQKNNLILPASIQQRLNRTFSFQQWLDQLYQKAWIVHCSKPTQDHQQSVRYLGRYVKRPAIAESKLKHYRNNILTFKYLDHKTNTYQKLSLSAEQFIARFIQHIPDKHFHMIRYYGFLSHKKRGEFLPIVYSLLGQESHTETVTTSTYADLIQRNFGFNPLMCILCRSPLVLTHIHFGKTAMNELWEHHADLALLKKCA